jgi:cation diffusion facilitator family transporter
VKADSVRTIFYALGANLAIAAAKTAAAIATGLSAMLAEAVHSYADSGNQGLLLWGMKQAKRPPSPDYPLGWGKAVFFWSFVVALVLFSLGGVFSLYEGWHKLAEPEDLSYPWVAVGILVFGLAAEAVSLRACLTEVNKVRGTKTLWRWFRESRQSELVVILGEDLAALLGLALALAAILVTIFSGNPMWDALGSMAIGVVLIIVAAGIATEIKGCSSARAPSWWRRSTAPSGRCAPNSRRFSGFSSSPMWLTDFELFEKKLRPGGPCRAPGARALRSPRCPP